MLIPTGRCAFHSRFNFLNKPAGCISNSYFFILDVTTRVESVPTGVSGDNYAVTRYIAKKFKVCFQVIPIFAFHFV